MKFSDQNVIETLLRAIEHYTPFALDKEERKDLEEAASLLEKELEEGILVKKDSNS